MDPLEIAGGLGEAIDHRLIDRNPLARSYRLADGAADGIEIGKNPHYPISSACGRSSSAACSASRDDFARGNIALREAVIVSTARTPIGKAVRGAFNATHGVELAAHAIGHAVKRAAIDPAEIEDVILGCGFPEGSTGSNIARLGALRAGLPVTVAGQTVNRFCSSGLMAISIAAQRIIVDGVAAAVAGGVESISTVPNALAQSYDPVDEALQRAKPEI